MKFTKEDASKELTAKLASKVEGIDKWKRTITENVETLWTLLGENSEIELSDFVEKALPLFNTTAGFLRKENADLAKSFEDKIKELESKNKPTPPPSNPNEELLNRLTALENENKKRLEEATAKEQKASLIAKIKEKGVKSSKWIESAVANVAYGGEFDVDAKATELLNMYNEMMADVNPSITPDKPNNPTNEYTSNIIKAASQIAKGGRLE